MPEPIKFYKITEPFGCFSNFAHYPIELDGTTWPTTEHYFQAQIFDDYLVQEKIRTAKTPMDAARLGRDRSFTLRQNWEQVKDDVMRKAVHAKFKQHEELKAVLLSTGGSELIEHTSGDRYWADGGGGSGRNMLGIILMEVRQDLRAESL